jgi:dTDP-4-dehydrorhamnose 3,5-epimerase
MIQGVQVTPLKQILDERGKIMQMLRSDFPVFQEFGEIYFSCINPGVVKGWHRHKHMTLNYAVPFGNIKFVLFDDRPDSPTKGEIQEFFLGPDNYCLVTVPPLIWNGFKGISPQPAIVANCATIPNDPNEIERLDPFDKYIPYNWDVKHR